MRTAKDVVGDGARGAVSDFLDAMIHHFGGPVGLATEWCLEYEQHERGTPGKRQMLDTAVRLMTTIGTENEGDAEKLEELQRQLAEIERDDLE